MSDEITRKTRSPINALKLINQLRQEKGLPKVSKAGAKPVKPKLSKEGKEELFRRVVQDIFPQALTDAQYEMSEKNVQVALAEFEKRLKEIQGVPAPRAPYTGKPRGRKAKV